MITVSALSALPGPCEGPYGTRRTLFLEGVRVIVPDAIQEKNLRWLLDRGMTFDNAYRQIGMWDEAPPQGMRSCCADVLRTKYYDPASGTWELSGWGHTCAGYFKCFEDYIAGLREHGEEKRGRIRIADGVYAPGPDEEACIRKRFVFSGNVARAYAECGATDILPRFPGAIDGLNHILPRPEAAGRTLYEMIKTLYELQPKPDLSRPSPAHHPAPPPVDHAPPSKPTGASQFALYAVIGTVILAVIISRR